jgi:hypothetical protein
VPLSPSSVSGLQWWLKADAIPSLSDGDTVVTWPDSSGNGYTGTAVNAPIYKTNQINGLPAVNFPSLTPAPYFSSSCPDDTNTLTIFAVVNRLLAGNYDVLFGSPTAGGAELRAEPGNKLELLRQNQQGLTMSTGTVPTGWQVWGADVTFASTATFNYYRNGTQDAQTGIGSAALTAGTTRQVGRESTSTSNTVMHGHIAELIIYSRILTAGERALVDTYLQQRYAIAMADYDSTPPTTPANFQNPAVYSTSADLSWNAATDAVGVAGYEVTVTGPM